MPKSYGDLLREARASIKELTPQEVEALPGGSATIVDVREASEWDQGHLPGAVHISKSYVEQQIEAAVHDRDTEDGPEVMGGVAVVDVDPVGIGRSRGGVVLVLPGDGGSGRGAGDRTVDGDSRAGAGDDT